MIFLVIYAIMALLFWFISEESSFCRVLFAAWSALMVLIMLNAIFDVNNSGYELSKLEYCAATTVGESHSVKTQSDTKVYFYEDASGETFAVEISPEQIEEIPGLDSPKILKRELKCKNSIVKAFMLDQFEEKTEYKLLIPEKNSLK